MNTFKTAKGTELPMRDLKGKDYLEVKFRLVWFREEHPSWGIETQVLLSNATEALVKATIKDESGRIVAVGHKTETQKDFPAGHTEKAETGAIGRALALCGYGTQFAPELDEGERIVDSPIERVKPLQTGHLKPVQTQSVAGYIISFGKYKGKRFSDIARDELMNYLSYLETAATPEKPLSETAKGFISAADAYLAKANPQGSLPAASASAASGTGLKEMPRGYGDDMPAFHADSDDIPF